MIDSTNPRSMADNIRYLSGASGDQASDISELKTTVEALNKLTVVSSDKFDTGRKWTDGRTIYGKVFVIESLPNNTSASVDLGFTFDKIIALHGVAQNISGFQGRIFGNTGNPSLYFTGSALTITTASDLSGASGIITVEFIEAAVAPSALTSPSPDDSRSIEPEVREEAPEEEPIEAESIEEPVAEVKKTTRKKSTN